MVAGAVSLGLDDPCQEVPVILHRFFTCID
jgi:hypothetical protein